jgi:hypothetical protein
MNAVDTYGLSVKKKKLRVYFSTPNLHFQSGDSHQLFQLSKPSAGVTPTKKAQH